MEDCTIVSEKLIQQLVHGLVLHFPNALCCILRRRGSVGKIGRCQNAQLLTLSANIFIVKSTERQE